MFGIGKLEVIVVVSRTAACALLSAGAPDMAHAQATKPGKPAEAVQAARPADPVYGPPLSGVCVFSRDAAIDNSTPGRAATKRMQELTAQVNTELQPERDAIAKEQGSLTTQKASLPASDLKSRADALAARALTFDQKVQGRNTQLTKTRQDALARLSEALRPNLIASITAHQCSAVFERANIYGFNAAMDITADVSTRMNAALQPFSFDLAAPSARN
jgi:Skp family chaperone for outer membrane proteins